MLEVHNIGATSTNKNQLITPFTPVCNMFLLISPHLAFSDIPYLNYSENKKTPKTQGFGGFCHLCKIVRNYLLENEN